MAKDGAIFFPHHGSDDGRAVANVELDPMQRLFHLFDPRDVGSIKEFGFSAGDPVADGGAAEGVEQGKWLKLDAADSMLFSRNDQAPLSFRDGEPVDQFPGLGGGPDRTGGALFEAECVIGMGVGEDDLGGPSFLDLMEPGGAAINHYPIPAMRKEGRGVHLVTNGLGLNFTPGS